MFTSNRLPVAAAVATAFALCATGALAQAVRIPVGDLSTPEAARAFGHRLEAAAQRICRPRYAAADLDGPAACKAAVRQEAIAQLTAAQQQAFAAAIGAPARLVSR